MEYLSQYEYSIMYINRKENTVADTLLQLPDLVDENAPVISTAAVFEIWSDPKLINQIKKGYHVDSWCNGILQDLNHEMLDTN